jgi:hypothetical protein
MSAARGALPLPLQDLLYVQVCLLQDELPAVADAAADSLANVSVDSLAPLLRDPKCDPLLVDHFARSGRLTGDALEAAISHPAIADPALEEIARTAEETTLNLIVTNEVRIIKNPRLLTILRANPNLNADNRRRLAELERDFVGKVQQQVRQAPAAPAAAPPAETAPLPEGAEAPPAEGAEGEAAQQPMTAEEQQSYEEALRRTPAFQRVMKLNVAEKVQLAMKGNAEERAILIRDTAKMVAHQVLKSPKLSDSEIAGYANLRSVSDEVLRIIASHRDWTKNYSVANALVRNPKTPPGVSIQFLPRLGTRDLKLVAGDKNIPEMLRRQARNIFIQRTQPPKKLGKKAH